MTPAPPARMLSITSRVLMGLFAVVIGASAIAKLVRAQAVVGALSKAGLGNLVLVIGVAELIYVVLFLIPRTRKLGFLLLTAHLGGAMATELAEHAPPVSAVLMALLWIATFLWDRGLFLPTPAKA